MLNEGYTYVKISRISSISVDNKDRTYIKIKEIGEDVRYSRNTEERSNILQRMRNEGEVHGNLPQISEKDTQRDFEAKNSVQRIQTDKERISGGLSENNQIK